MMKWIKCCIILKPWDLGNYSCELRFPGVLSTTIQDCILQITVLHSCVPGLGLFSHGSSHKMWSWKHKRYFAAILMIKILILRLLAVSSEGSAALWVWGTQSILDFPWLCIDFNGDILSVEINHVSVTLQLPDVVLFFFLRALQSFIFLIFFL